MLWFLFFILLFLTLMSYYLCDRDLIAPPFVLNAMFMLCSIFSIIGNRDWVVSFSIEAVAVIFLGLASILIGSIFVNACIKSSRPAGISMSSAFKPKYISISAKKLLLMAVVDLIILILYFRRLMDMAVDIGYSGKMFLQFVRVATINNGTKVGTFFTVTLGFVAASGNLAMFALINNHFHKADNDTKIKTNRILCLVLITLSLAVKALSAARNGFISFFVSMIAYYILCNPNKKKIKLSKILPIVCLTLFAFFTIFVELGKMTGKTGDDPVSKVVLYAGSSIAALSVWLEDYSRSKLLGSESFWGVRYLLNMFFPGLECESQFLESVHFPGGGGTNIFTGFRSYMADFGWLGMIVICFCVGCAMTLIYKKARTSSTPLSIILFSYFLYYYINMLFAPSITSALFTSSQIFGIFWYIVVIQFALKKSDRKAIRLR